MTATGPREDVNMADVARIAGVSSATVSRALRGVPGVSEPTRRRVLDVAHELSYVVSPEASQLSRRSTGRVAVVLPRVDTWFFSTILAAIESEMNDAGVDVLVYQVADEQRRQTFFTDLPSRRKVDAVVLVAPPLRATEVERLQLLGVHVIVAGGRLRDYPHVEVDDEALARAATEHLISRGHSRLALIRTTDTDGAVWSSDEARLRGFHAAVGAAAHVSSEVVVSETYDAAAGARGMARLMSLDEPPTAVLCYSDEIAVAALSELGRRGLRCPEDVALVGIDGHPLAELFDLTSADQSVEEQGHLAARMALALVRGETVAATHVQVAWRLRRRGSSG